jgi:hypothetical protein
VHVDANPSSVLSFAASLSREGKQGKGAPHVPTGAGSCVERPPYEVQRYEGLAVRVLPRRQSVRRLSDKR